MMVVSKCHNLVRVSSVSALQGFSVRVSFTDGSQRDIDLRPYLDGPIFEPIRRDSNVFRQVYVDHGALAWPNGADIDPDTLYYGVPPPWEAEEHNAETVTAERP